MSKYERIPYIDVLRGLAIYLIVLGHFTELAGDFYLFVFSFHVQLFFFISGIFSERVGDIKNTVKYIWMRIIRPYVFISFINAFFFMVYNRQGPVSLGKMVLEALLGRRNHIFCANLWFFPCLAIMIFIYALLRRVVSNPIIRLSICFILSISMRLIKEDPVLIWSIDSAILYIFYYSLGDVMAPLLLKEKGGLVNNKTLSMTIIVSLSLFALLWYTGFDNLCQIAGIILPVAVNKLIRFFAAIILILFAVVCAYAMRNIEALGNIGKHTMIIAGTEQIIRLTVKSCADLLGLQYRLSEPIQVLIYTAIIVCICYMISNKLNKWFPGVFAKDMDHKKMPMS